MNKAKKISKLSKVAVITLASTAGAGVVAAPFTGGASLLATAAGTSAGAGITTGVIFAAIAAGGILTVYALYKDYNVHFQRDSNGDIKLKFEKKSYRNSQ